jgi:hypothetical protein
MVITLYFSLYSLYFYSPLLKNGKVYCKLLLILYLAKLQLYAWHFVIGLGLSAMTTNLASASQPKGASN